MNFAERQHRRLMQGDPSPERDKDQNRHVKKYGDECGLCFPKGKKKK